MSALHPADIKLPVHVPNDTPEIVPQPPQDTDTAFINVEPLPTLAIAAA